MSPRLPRHSDVDTLLTVASAFDWITPLWAFVQDFLNGPVADFGIPSDAGWATWDIKRLLKENGIEVWGLMLDFSGGTLMFTCRKSQAIQVHALLTGEGIPILYAPAEIVNPRSWWQA